MTARTAFAAGDRVRIISRDHPWYGSTGTISAPFSPLMAPDLQWTISLDATWGEAAVAEREIRKIS